MRKKAAIGYLLIFVILIGGIGLLSEKNLFDFYVNVETDYNEWSASLGNKFETDIATTFYEKFQFVNVNGLFRKMIGQREMNGVIKLNNGYLYTTMEYVEDERIIDYGNRVVALERYLSNRGTKFVYVMAPCTSGKYDPQLPVGVSDYGNDNADRMVSYLKEQGIDSIDLRERMHEDGINHYDMMYRTDHHWNTKAGFYAYQVLEEYIVNQIGCHVDPRISDESQYTIRTYENWHLGSRGQRTGVLFAGIDDFDLYLPNFETKILGAGKEGNVQDVAISMEPLANRKQTSKYTYDWVFDPTFGYYVSQTADNDIKLMMLADSFGKAVNPYLIMAFSEFTGVFNMQVSSVNPEFIEQYDPDVVVMLYFPESAMKEESYSFQGFE